MVKYFLIFLTIPILGLDASSYRSCELVVKLLSNKKGEPSEFIVRRVISDRGHSSKPCSRLLGETYKASLDASVLSLSEGDRMILKYTYSANVFVDPITKKTESISNLNWKFIRKKSFWEFW